RRSALQFWSCSLLTPWLPLQELSRTRLADKLLLLNDDFAARENRFHLTSHFAPFVRVVVDAHVMCLSGQDMFFVGIKNQQVGVGAGCDRAFLGEETENLGGRCGSQLDEPVEIDASLPHSSVEDQVHAGLDSRRAVGDLGEIVLAELLLLFHAERAVVGRDRLQIVSRESPPELLLVS